MVIIVPYRSRPEHLEQFTKVMAAHDVYIIEQADDKPFNRGKLINVGFLETGQQTFVAHDVDMLPVNVFYSVPLPGGVVQLASNTIQTHNYLGGVTLFDAFAFKMAGGYHNDYYHRAEDNEMMFNLLKLRIPVMHRFGTFVDLPHPRTGPEFIPELWQKAQLPRTKNMLKTCEYELISKKVYETHTHLRVLL